MVIDQKNIDMLAEGFVEECVDTDQKIVYEHLLSKLEEGVINKSYVEGYLDACLHANNSKAYFPIEEAVLLMGRSAAKVYQELQDKETFEQKEIP